MKNVRIYKPFDREYTIIKENNNEYLEIGNYKLMINPNGYIPKSGLLYDEVLNIDLCKGKNVLDLGCGYLGILGVIALMNGANYVDSVDIDEKAIEWFKKIIVDNNLSAQCFYSNMFENIHSKYDLILSNPPILPMKSGHVHDSGGLDGKDYLREILRKSYNYLNESGSIVLLIFDYLGIEKSYNGKETLFDFASRIGYNSLNVLYEGIKTIKKNSETYNNLDYIKSIYPFYDFGKENDLQCKIKIVKFSR